MAGMPKQGYKNLVLPGWVPDPALGWGGMSLRVALGWAGGHGDTREGDREGKGKERWERIRRKGKACLTERRNLIRAELYSPAKDTGYFRDIGKK